MSYIVRSLTKSELEIYRRASKEEIVRQYWKRGKTVLSVILAGRSLEQVRRVLFG